MAQADQLNSKSNKNTSHVTIISHLLSMEALLNSTVQTQQKQQVRYTMVQTIFDLSSLNFNLQNYKPTYDIYITMKQNQRNPHIVVIGGGLSGLTAAREILKKQPKYKVTVLEANDYLGGRTKSIILNNCNFDLGAQFIGPSQHHVIELAHQSKNELLPVNDKGKKIVDFKQGFDIYTGQIPRNVNILGLIEMQLTLMKINRMAKKVPADNPRNCPWAYKWDSMTVQSWIQQNLSFKKTRIMLQGALRVILGVDLSQISFLYFLNYVHQSKSFENLITVQNGLQQKKTSKGTQQLSLFLGQRIKQMRGDIKLNFYVKNITQNEQKVTVIDSKGQKIEGNYLIMAMPPPNVAKINFQPKLSVQRRMLCQRSFMGTLAKILILYPEAYWSNKGFTGEILSDCFDAPVMNVFDDSRVNLQGKVQPALAVFVGGGVYKYWKDKQNFEKRLTQKLAQFFKESKLLHPIIIKWNAWENQASIGGAPVSNIPPGVLTQISDLRKPEGRIHWAGTELATVSTGFMDGAIESGKRVAKEILSRCKDDAEKKNEKFQEIKFPYTFYNRTPQMSFLSRIFEWW